MGEERTISIDPTLFSGGKSKEGEKQNRTLRKQRKIKPKVNNPNANTLRKNLLAKIKEHQKKEQVETKRKNLLLQQEQKKKPSSIINDDVFEDEFTRSLAYLSALSKNRENKSVEKKKTKLKFRNHGVQPNIHMSSPIINQTTFNSNVNSTKENIKNDVNQHRHNTIKRIPDQPTGKQSSLKNSNVPEISLEMPPELISPLEVQVLPNHNTEASTISPVISINNDPPYGVLKGGKKPTYRSYNHTQKNTSSFNNQTQTQTQTQTQRQTLSSPHIPQVVSAREHILNEMKEKRRQNNDDNAKPLTIPNYTHNNSFSNENTNKEKPFTSRRSKTVKRTTRTRHFKLGKDAKRRVISVFIKNNKTRRQVKLEIGQLKRIPIKDVKSYLRKHNLLKVGSSAPNDVLRHIYEQSILSGDINNLAKDTLIYNFLNDHE